MRIAHRSSLLALASLLAAGAMQGQPARAARHETVRGTITADSGRPVPGATVVVTRTSDKRWKSSDADASGRWSTDWPDGTGDYDVHVMAEGFTALTAHVARRSGGDTVLVADIQLAPMAGAQRLPTVVTSAQRPQPSRDPNAPDVAVSSFVAIPQNAARRVGPDQAGDLAALAAMAPGVMSVGGGISVFGLGSGANSTTLNGLAFNATDIPRDAFTRVRVTSSSYDPSIGWFNGARTQVDLAPGALFTSRNAHLTVDAPAAQFTDPVSAQLGQRYTNFSTAASAEWGSS